MNEQVSGNPAPPEGVGRLLAVWSRVENTVALAAFIFISGITVYDVFAREVLGPILHATGLPPTALVIPGAPKLGVYALIAGAFLGLGIATQAGSQIIPKVAFAWVPERWNLQMNRLADAFSGLFFLGAAVVAIVFVLSSRDSGMLTTGAFRFPAWMVQSVMPLAFLSVSIRYFIYAVWPAYRPVLPEISE